MLNERDYVVKELNCLIEYGNLTEAAQSIIMKAMQIISSGDEIDKAEDMVTKIKAMFELIKEEYDRMEERMARNPVEKQTPARILTREELQKIKEEMLVWFESQHSKQLLPLEYVGIRKDDEGMDVLWFTDNSGNYMDEEGDTYRIWDRKPTKEQREETPWTGWKKKGEKKDGVEQECVQDDCDGEG